MARILGDLRAEDDFLHPLGPEKNFNESMYFNFFDAERGLGGFCRIGNRANEGHAETTVCLFLPDGRVLFDFQRPPIPGNDAFAAGGLRFEVLEAGQRLRSVYAGSPLELREPRAMADPRRAFGENPRRPASFDLVHDAVGPMYGSAGQKREADRDPDQQFARAHYEQHMRVTGELRLGEEAVRLDGFGLRDHSWGPRTWQSIHAYDWLTLNFGADLGAMVSVIRRDAAGRERTQGGVVVRGMELERIVAAEVEADTEENGLYHRALRARLRTERGETLELEGEVMGFIPLRHRREGEVTHIGEGMTRWRLGGRTGYGLSELLRRVR